MHEEKLFLANGEGTSCRWIKVAGEDGTFELAIADGQEHSGMKLAIGEGEAFSRNCNSAYVTLVKGSEHGTHWKTSEEN